MDEGAFDRRRFIKGAATVVWATPLVLTLGASSANAQSPGSCLGDTGKGDGCFCTATSQCAAGCCCTFEGFFQLCLTFSDCAFNEGTCL